MGDDTPEREMKDFQFRQMKKIRVFASPDDLPRGRSSLLAISNKFGLTFVSQGKALKVFVTGDIISAGKVTGNPNEIVECVQCQALTVDLPVHHLALSNDELTLSVCGASEEASLTLDFYDVRTFFNKSRQDKRPFASFKAGSQPDTLVQDLKWSPAEAFRVAACLSDGSMMVLDVTDKIVPVAQLPASVGITCICWSPKGKQIAAGKQDATVVQFTPDLQQKKVIPCPSFYTADNPVKVLDVLWLSTYNFAVVYAAADGSPETPPELVMVSLPKKDEKKEDKFLNFSDIVFGSCTERQHHYFLNHIEDWDLILAASAASIEVSIIAKQEDKTNWELWLLEDASRAELPVTLKNDDTLPVGVAIDYTSQGEIYISDEKQLPPAPTLLILSTDGLLCPFSLINVNPGVKQLVVSPGSLPQSGERPPLQKSLPLIQAPATSKPPPPVFSSFQVPSITPASTSAPPTSSATPAAPASSSLGVSFSLPSTTSSLFSFSAASTAPSIFPSASGFSFAAPKPASEAPALPAFTFGSLGTKPLTEGTSTSGHVATATASPVTLLKGGAEPPTPNVRVNLNDRFLAAETPNPHTPSSQPFSFTSTPKPAALESSAQPKQAFAINKPAAPPPVTRPAPAQNSTPSAAVQKTAPAPTASPAPPSTQLSSVKFVEKKLQQTKDIDPVILGIQEEISHFKKEMDELKTRVKGADFCVGSSDEMRELRKESEDLHRFTLEIKETTESMHGDVSTLKTTLLEGFAGAEEARAQRELYRDKGYLQLLYKKPLDPRTESQLKEIRRLYQYVKFTVEDVNDVLDLEWEKHLEKKRKQKYMIVPEREALYTALANNMDIINQQKQKLEHLVRDLQSLRLYNKTSSQLSSTSSPSPSSSSQGLDSELESLKNALLKASLDTAPKAASKSPSKMTPVKQSQLRNFLSKRQTPPVRSTAPGNLSRSAFLSPKYFEDLDDVSSTSSQYQPPECDDPLPVPEEVEVPQPVPNPSRHPAVVRTSSVLPRSIMESVPSFPGAMQWSGISTGPHTVPKINMDSADSTALATKTVTHGPPPTEKAVSHEKTTPTALPPAQAAGRAALNRHMNSQNPIANLTELTLKNVPQVVNVQELKDTGATVPVSTDTSSSMASSADQTFQQVLATVEAKKNPTQSAIKVHPPVTDSAPAQPGFVFGQLTKPDTAAPFSLSSSLEPHNSKGVSPAGFPFNLSTTSSQSQGASSSQSVTQVGKIPQKPATSAQNSTSEPGKSSTIPLFQALKAQEDSLGPFLDLRVGPGDEVKESPKPSTTFTFKPPSAAPGTAFTFGNLTKPATAGNNPETSSTTLEASRNPGIFKPPESTESSLTSKKFSFTPASSASVPSFSSLLATPLSQETTPVTEKAPEPEPSPPLESVSTATPEEPSSEPSAEASAISTSTPSPASVTEEPPPSQIKHEEPEIPVIQTASVPQATPTSMQSVAETVPVTASKPVQETTPATTVSVEQQQPAAEPAAPPPPSTTPGSIFTQPAVSSNSTTLPVTIFTPVISTAATSISAPAPSPVFSQAITTSTPAFGSPGFGVPSTTSNFGKPVFGQPTSVGFPSAGSFSFNQFAFGGSSGFGQTAAPSTAPAPVSSGGGGGGGGGLFGSVSTTSASSFSFGSNSTSSGANAGTSIFGQSSAPAFGQSSSSTSTFGQGSLFGGNTTTTTVSSGFGFGQPAMFGSTSSSSVFGQQPSTNSVFGQPSSGGGLFGSGAPSSSGGGFFSGLGGKPSEDAANKNPFGSTNTGAFGQTNQTGGSLFGNTGAKTFGFGGVTFGEQKPSGTFSAGGGSVAAQGFGSFSTPAKTGGFGSSPAFGSPPAFGGSPAFGGHATFGSAPAFTSPLGSTTGKVFGEGTSASNVGGFGFASPPSGPTFGSLTPQNSTPTFGGLAQQTPGFGGQSAGFSGFGPSGGFGGFVNTNTNQSSSQTFAGWRS